MKRKISRLRSGVALIIVLGFVALLSLLVAGLMDTLRVRMVEGQVRSQRASLRSDADSAIDVVRARLAVFESDGNGFYLNTADLEKMALDPLAGWTPPDGATVTVRLRDESGLFAINTTTVASLRNLFEAVGVGEDRAVSLADYLADWIDSDDSRRAQGAESDAYGVPGLPADRKLRSFDELRLVKGFDQVFFNADGTPNEQGVELRSIVTLLDTGSAPNVNGAPEAVLKAMGSRFGVDAGALLSSRSPLDYPDDRKHQGVFHDAGELSRLAPSSDFTSQVTYAARSIRVVVTVSKGDLSYLADAVISNNPGNSNRPVIVSKRSDEVLLSDASGDFAEGSSATTESDR